ncbi:hypothetical protein PAEPH01_0744 [Pancytospora epiphaga]|nr:hypothetical protein PAEPH01_0744 [Pancytospora epiphaga]
MNIFVKIDFLVRFIKRECRFLQLPSSSDSKKRAPSEQGFISPKPFTGIITTEQIVFSGSELLGKLILNCGCEDTTMRYVLMRFTDKITDKVLQINAQLSLKKQDNTK